MKYTLSNAAAIDRWITDEGWPWGIPVSHETFERAVGGDWDVLLTPTKPVPHRWFGELARARVLCLASGGGQQAPIFTALGARCTVLDFSERQIATEREVAEREGYGVALVRADMTEPLPFEDAAFDLIFHPVSNCYIQKVEPLWRECFRVLRPGGALLSGLGNGINDLFDDDEREPKYRLPFDPLENEEYRALSERNDWGMQFSHTIDEQIGGQLRAGFALEDIYEDTNGEGRLHDLNAPTYYATLSRRPLG